MSTDTGFRPHFKRKKFFIDKDFQASYSFTWMVLSYCLVVAIAFFSVTGTMMYYKYIATNVYKGDPRLQTVLITFFAANILLIVIMIAAVIVVSVVHSHRAAGAIFRMKKDMQEVLAGDYNVTTVLREKDYFKDLAAQLNQLFARLKTTYHNREIATDAVAEMAAAVEKDPSCSKALKELAATLRQRVLALQDQESGATPDGTAAS